MELEEYIVTQLKALTSNVYVQLNPGNTFPCVIYSLEGTEPVEVMSQATDYESRDMQLIVWSYDKSEAVSLAKSIQSSLDNTSTSTGINIDKIIYKNMQDTETMLANSGGYVEEKKLFGRIIDFEIWLDI